MRSAATLFALILAGSACTAIEGGGDVAASDSAISGSLAQARARQIRDAYRAATPADFRDVALESAPKAVGDRVASELANDGASVAAAASFEVTGMGRVLVVEIRRPAGPATAPTAPVLDRLGDCLDKDLFDAIRLQDLRTSQRTAANNANGIAGWDEDANRCTGCSQVACSACHADGTAGFSITADAATSFGRTKNSANLRAYFAIGEDGQPTASNAIERKATHTAQSPAYTHPLYTVTPAAQAALDAFVGKAIQKFKAGTCGSGQAPTVTEDLLFFTPAGAYAARGSVKSDGTTTFYRPSLAADGKTYELLPLD